MKLMVMVLLLLVLLELLELFGVGVVGVGVVGVGVVPPRNIFPLTYVNTCQSSPPPQKKLIHVK